MVKVIMHNPTLFLHVTKVGDGKIKGVYFFLKQGCLFAILSILRREKYAKHFSAPTHLILWMVPPYWHSCATSLARSCQRTGTVVPMRWHKAWHIACLFLSYIFRRRHPEVFRKMLAKRTGIRITDHLRNLLN